jgi:hypothetical protein
MKFDDFENLLLFFGYCNEATDFKKSEVYTALLDKNKEQNNFIFELMQMIEDNDVRYKNEVLLSNILEEFIILQDWLDSGLVLNSMEIENIKRTIIESSCNIIKTQLYNIHVI